MRFLAISVFFVLCCLINNNVDAQVRKTKLKVHDDDDDDDDNSVSKEKYTKFNKHEKSKYTKRYNHNSAETDEDDDDDFKVTKKIFKDEKFNKRSKLSADNHVEEDRKTYRKKVTNLDDNKRSNKDEETKRFVKNKRIVQNDDVGRKSKAPLPPVNPKVKKLAKILIDSDEDDTDEDDDTNEDNSNEDDTNEDDTNEDDTDEDDDTNEDNTNEDDDTDEDKTDEDDTKEESFENIRKRKKKMKVCNQRKGKSDDCMGVDVDEEDEDDGTLPKKKVKYSIKFAHEKNKKQENKQDSILRIHRDMNGKKSRKNRFNDDDNSSEEEAGPKRFRLLHDDDD